MEVGSLYLVKSMVHGSLREHRVTFLGEQSDGRLLFDCRPRGHMLLPPDEIVEVEPTEFWDEWYQEPWKHSYHYKNRDLARFPKPQGISQ